jgi:hypothetical protein
MANAPLPKRKTQPAKKKGLKEAAKGGGKGKPARRRLNDQAREALASDVAKAASTAERLGFTTNYWDEEAMYRRVTYEDVTNYGFFQRRQKRKLLEKWGLAAPRVEPRRVRVEPTEPTKSKRSIPQRPMLKRLVLGKIEARDVESSIAHYKDAFSEIDAKGKGFIKLRELVNALRECGLEVNADAATRVMKELDPEFSGEIELQEFIDFFQTLAELRRYHRKSEQQWYCCTSACALILLANAVAASVLVLMFVRGERDQMIIRGIIATSVICPLSGCFAIVLPLCYLCCSRMERDDDSVSKAPARRDYYSSDGFSKDASQNALPLDDPLEGHMGAWGSTYGTNDAWGNMWDTGQTAWGTTTDDNYDYSQPTVCQAAAPAESSPGKSWRHERQEAAAQMIDTAGPVKYANLGGSGLGQTWEDGPGGAWSRASDPRNYDPRLHRPVR